MYRPRDLVLGVAGHIDHGKTALVRALTGVDTDRLPDEKRRGLTIDLGFAALKLGKNSLSIIDVPGHERFVRNMLAGATGFDLALIVVAADDSVMPQTREHLEILRILGLNSGVVAITKCDLADEVWIGLVEEEIRSLLTKSPLNRCPIVRTSATTGQGIEELKVNLERVCDSAPPRIDPGLFRMAIDRSFAIPGHGTVVTGTVASGTVAVGDALDWLPRGEPVRVRGLHRHDRAVETLSRGARAAVNLAGISHARIGRGDELAAQGYLAPSRVISVEVFGTTESPRALRHRGRYRLHMGTCEVPATLGLLDGDFIPTHTTTFGQLIVNRPIVAVHGEPFVLREESPMMTVGGGRVLRPVARRLRRRDSSAISRLEGLCSAEPTARLAAALSWIGLESWTERSLCRDSGVPIAAIPAMLDSLESSGAIDKVRIGPRRVVRLLSSIATEFEERILRTLGRLHAMSPRLSSIPRARVVAAMAYFGDDELIDGLIDRLLARGKLIGDARTIAIAGHEPKLSHAEQRLKEEIAETFKAGGASPPDPSVWTKSNPRGSAVPDLLTLLCEEERIVPIAPPLYLDFEVATEIRRRVIERLSDGSTLSMSQLRDLIGTTRKYAVPIGEYLDRIGLTLRVEDVRRLRSPQAPPESDVP